MLFYLGQAPTFTRTFTRPTGGPSSLPIPSASLPPRPTLSTRTGRPTDLPTGLPSGLPSGVPTSLPVPSGTRTRTRTGRPTPSA